jgi:carbon monoxide dehydrogenase subunit G
MKLSHTATIAAPADRVWAVVMDLPLAARCVPGVTAVEPTGSAGAFTGSLPVQIGPVRLTLAGVVQVTARDDATWHGSLRADAKDARLGGTVRATVDLSLREVGAGCELRVESDLAIAGRLGEFGQPVIKRKADQILAEFAACLGRSAGSVSP